MAKNMQKRTIIKEVAAATGNTLKHTGQVVESFLEEIIRELKAGNRLEFRGFGVFEIVTRKEKRARNPKTNEEVIVPPQKVVRFKMGKDMREIF